MASLNTPDAEEAYARVKAGFIAQRMTLARWCSESGLQASNVRAAFAGRWKGPRAEEVIRAVLRASGAEAE